MVGNVFKYPRWYTLLKWGVPLGLSFITATWLGLVIVGSFPAAAFLAWAPTLYQGTAGLEAALALSVSMCAVACWVGVLTSIFVRGVILFQVNENLATASVSYIEKRSAEEALGYTARITALEGLLYEFEQQNQQQNPHPQQQALITPRGEPQGRTLLPAVPRYETGEGPRVPGGPSPTTHTPRVSEQNPSVIRRTQP